VWGSNTCICADWIELTQGAYHWLKSGPPATPWELSATRNNAVAESLFGTLQLELLDGRTWTTRKQLAAALFEWIECFYNPQRRHSYCGMFSPID